MNNSNEITIYSPGSRLKVAWLRSLKMTASNIFRFRNLLWQLFRRDFLAAYKKSFLGYLWLFISPLVGVLSWVVMYSAGILKPGTVDVPYPVYVLLGTTFWTFWTGVYGGAAGTLQSGAGLMTQVKYPHEVLLAKQLIQHFVSFAISLTCIFIVVGAFGVFPNPLTLLLPLVLLPAVFLGIAIGLVTSMVSVVLPDLTQIINMGIGFLIYLSPIIYAPDAQGNRYLKIVNNYNPLTHIVCSARDIVLHGRLYDTAGFMWTTGISFIAMLISLRLFFVAEQRLIEKMV